MLPSAAMADSPRPPTRTCRRGPSTRASTVIWQGDPDRLGVEGAVLSGVDNITVDAGTGDLIVAQDGGNMELVLITPDGQVAISSVSSGPVTRRRR